MDRKAKGFRVGLGEWEREKYAASLGINSSFSCLLACKLIRVKVELNFLSKKVKVKEIFLLFGKKFRLDKTQFKQITLSFHTINFPRRERR